MVVVFVYRPPMSMAGSELPSDAAGKVAEGRRGFNRRGCIWSKRNISTYAHTYTLKKLPGSRANLTTDDDDDDDDDDRGSPLV